MNEDKNKPHGLGIGFKAEVFDNVNGELIPVQTTEENGSKLEAYINIKNEKTGKEAELPMRSFVQTFLTVLYRYFTGSDNATDAYTRNRSVSYQAITSTLASGASKKGLLCGTGITGVTLSDVGLETPLAHASLAYGNVTFVPPYISDVTTKTMKFEVRRMLTSVRATTTYITELIVKTRAAFANETASGGASAVNLKPLTISRDLLANSVDNSEGLTRGDGIPVNQDEGIAFQFKFKLSQVTTGANQGGAVLNFVKMIYNQLFKGNPNGAVLLDDNGSNLAITYANGTFASDASTGNPFHVADTVTNYGILVGIYDKPAGSDYYNPPINCDDYKFEVKTTGLTIGATEVAAITNPSKANTAQFIVSRTFTNSGVTTLKLNRAGLKIKGDAFIAINTLAEPSDNQTGNYLALQPNQVLKVSYPFEVQA